MRLPSSFSRAGRAVLAGLFCLPASFAVAAKPPGGFLEASGSAQARQMMSRSQIQSLLPERGRFTFPAPYNTEAFRLTNPSDCGGSDCVHYVGYSYWRNTNNHVGRNKMYILVGLRRNSGGPGPSLFEFDKRTETVRPLGPVFASSDAMSWSSAAGMYFSGSLPNALYVAYNATLRRYDVMTRQYETVFNVESLLGNGYRIAQAHSSDDDRVHSATLKSSGNNADLGCVLYREAANDITFFAKKGPFDECQVDRSGQWLVIKENVDGQAGEDNRIINVQTLEERLLLDQEGAGGHSDLGHGYMVAANNWGSQANTRVLWKLDEYPLQSTRIYHNNDWNIVAPNHISHTNSVPGLLPDEQFACGSSANRSSSAHANEIICFGLAGTGETLVVAPVMTDLDASGGKDFYGKLPKGNLDVTGQYFIWTSNMRSSRLDAFMVKVPGQLLVGESFPPVNVLPQGEVIFFDGFER